jgi:hypothetical protein
MLIIYTLYTELAGSHVTATFCRSVPWDHFLSSCLPSDYEASGLARDFSPIVLHAECKVVSNCVLVLTELFKNLLGKFFLLAVLRDHREDKIALEPPI